MTSDDAYWLKYPNDLIKKGESYLIKHGYQDHDLKALVDALPAENPSGPNRNALKDILDNRPNAEIVATANMVFLAKAALKAYELQDIQTIIECMFYLGHAEAVAKLFVMDPGHSPEMVTDHDRFLYLTETSKRYSEDYVKKMIRMDHIRSKRPDHKDRNNWLNSEARRLLGPGLGNGKKHWQITSILVNRYSREHPKAVPLSAKQIRRILRDAEVIPPARSRK